MGFLMLVSFFCFFFPEDIFFIWRDANGICGIGKQFNVDIEGWHTESGPGVYEAALEYGEIRGMADRASLFK